MAYVAPICYLQAKYANFYKNIKKISFESIKEQAQPQTNREINQWLCKMARVKTVEALKTKFPKTVNDLVGLLKLKKVPLSFNYQSAKDGLGSQKNSQGSRRSCRLINKR